MPISVIRPTIWKTTVDKAEHNHSHCWPSLFANDLLTRDDEKGLLSSPEETSPEETTPEEISPENQTSEKGIIWTIHYVCPISLLNFKNKTSYGVIISLVFNVLVPILVLVLYQGITEFYQQKDRGKRLRKSTEEKDWESFKIRKVLTTILFSTGIKIKISFSDF